MRLLNYKENNNVKLALETTQGIIAVERLNPDNFPQSTDELIRSEHQASLQSELNIALNNINMNECLESHNIDFMPAVLNPEKILCVGMNYSDHVSEMPDATEPKEPVIFSKFNNALAAHKEAIPLPKEGALFDYEAELVIIIGKEAKDVAEEKALSHVFGYTIGNDLSVRDLQFKTGQWLIGKTPDKFAPIGPVIVTADSIDPNNLNISLKRNHETVQVSNTKHMIFDVAFIVSYLSKYMTLKPGDLIFTGTPAGVIQGYPEDEQKWLEVGDKLEVHIEDIGVLVNNII